MAWPKSGRKEPATPHVDAPQKDAPHVPVSKLNTLSHRNEGSKVAVSSICIPGKDT